MPVAAENLYASTTGCIAYRSDVQSSGVDYLHMLIASIEYPVERYHIQAQYFISVHDELRYLVKEDKDRAALQIFTFVDESDVCVCARYGQFTAGCRIFFGGIVWFIEPRRRLRILERYGVKFEGGIRGRSG